MAVEGSAAAELWLLFSPCRLLSGVEGDLLSPTSSYSNWLPLGDLLRDRERMDGEGDGGAFEFEEGRSSSFNKLFASSSDL